MKKIYLSRNLKDEISSSTKSSNKIVVFAIASIYGDVQWMFLNSCKKSFTSVFSSSVLGFVIVKDTLKMCATVSDNKLNIDIGGNDIYISEVKTDVPEHMDMVVTFNPLPEREYDEMFSYPEENQKELKIE